MIHHLYIVWCVHPPKSSLLLSPFIPLYPLLPAPHPSFALVITRLLILLSLSVKFPSHPRPSLNPFTFFTCGTSTEWNTAQLLKNKTKQNGNLTVCSNMDGPGEYYAK